MTVRFRVLDTFPSHGAGPMIIGLLEDGVIVGGETLIVEETGVRVRLTRRDVHTRLTDEGVLMGLQLNPDDAAAVTPGSTLLGPTEA